MTRHFNIGRQYDRRNRLILMIFLTLIPCVLVGLEAAATPQTNDDPVENAQEAGRVEMMRFAVNIGPKEQNFLENTYVVFNPETKVAIIVDPGARDERIDRFIAERDLTVKLVLNTHGHHDHIGGNTHYADLYGVKIAAHRAADITDAAREADPGIFTFLDDDQVLEFDGLTIRVLHTPGHTQDAICFLVGENLFSGDTLFRESIGRTWGDTDQERREKTRQEIAHIKTKLLVLPDETRVHPGHGPPSTIKHEKTANPFLH